MSDVQKNTAIEAPSVNSADEASPEIKPAPEKKRTWLTTEEKQAKWRAAWGEPAVKGACHELTDEQLTEIFAEQKAKGRPNTWVAWKHLGCADNMVPTWQKQVGADRSKAAQNRKPRKKGCGDDAVCEIGELNSQIEDLIARRNEVESNSEAKMRDDLKEHLEAAEKLKAVLGDE